MFFENNGIAMLPSVTILGVPVHAVTMQQAVECIRTLLQVDGQYHVCTPNPEMLVAAAFDTTFLSVLQHASLSIPDGTGLLWAAKRCGGVLPERVTGVDLLEKIAALPEAGSIFFLGAAPGIAKQAAEALHARHPMMQIAGTYSGSPKQDDEQEILRRIHASSATTLLVAFGAPHQERWIHRNLPKLTTIRLAIGIGGAFDFLAGKQHRAPSYLRSLGLEWLWRLSQQPSRLPRIFTATVRFPLLVIRYRSAHPALHA